MKTSLFSLLLLSLIPIQVIFSQDKTTLSISEIDSLIPVYYQQQEYQKVQEYADLMVQKASAAGNDTAKISGLSWGGFIRTKQAQYELAENLYLECLELIKKARGTKHSDYPSMLNNITQLYQRLTLFEEAEAYGLKALEVWKAGWGENHFGYISALNNIGLVYYDMHRFTQSTSYYKQALELSIKNYGATSQISESIEFNLAGIYYTADEIEQAIEIYSKQRKNLKEANDYLNQKYCFILSHLTECYLKIEDYKTALEFAKENVAVSALVYNKENTYYGSALQTQAKVYHKTKNHQEALSYLMPAIAIFEARKFPNPNDYISALYDLSQVYRSNEQLDLAVEACEQALKAMTLDQDSIFFQNLNGIDRKTFYTQEYLSKILLEYQKIQLAYYEKTQKTNYLEKADSALRMAIKLQEVKKSSFGTDEDKLRNLELNSKLVQESIETSLQLAQLKDDTAYLEQAFQHAEMNKSVLLSETLKASNARSLGKLPDSLLQKEMSLKKQSDQLKKQQLEIKDDSSRAVLLAETTTLNNEINSLLRIIKKDYPKYHALKYEQQAIALQAIQEQLDEASLLLEYFIAEEKVYLFRISAKELKVFTLAIPQKTLATKIKKFHYILSDYSLIKKDPKASFNSYCELGYWFYKELLSQALEGQNSKRLIIIADGALGHIPFETFLTQAVEQKEVAYHQLPYLLRSYELSYHYAAALWLENKLQPSSNSSKEILAYAASYQTQEAVQEQTRSFRAPHLRNLRQSLEDLPAAREEVLNLAQYFKGTFLIDSAANEQSFKQMAADYRIIHLAMHGILNQEQPILSSLAFTENGDSLEDNFLQAYEISHLPLNAELVVLSACETGYGKFQEGEGVMSLARSFMYTGVPSMVVSLWQVSDASTSYIMQQFYQELSQGKNKAAALQAAKLNYIETVAASSQVATHPAFWAAFIQLGDDRPVAIAGQQNASWIWWIGLAVLGLGVLALAIRLINRKPSVQ